MNNGLWVESPKGDLVEVHQVEVCGQRMIIRPAPSNYQVFREILSPLWLNELNELVPNELYGDKGGDLLCIIGLSEQGIVLDNGLMLAGELTLPLILALVDLASKIAREDVAEQLTKGFVDTLRENIPQVAQRLHDHMLD